MGIDFVVDAFWGSGGKGKVSATISDRFGHTTVSTSNHPNAGHTYRDNDKSIIFKVLHSASALSNRECFISADSVFDPEQLAVEMESCGDISVMIHERATILMPSDKDAELMQGRIASTMQGGCIATMRKMDRPGYQLMEPTLRLNPKLRNYMNHGCLSVLDNKEFFRQYYKQAVDGDVLHEVAQGYGLSIDHGTHYPHCTYRNCLVASALDDLGMPAKLVGRVILVVRTFPIRVGNLDGNSSGDFPLDSHETTWEEIYEAAGFPQEERKPEYTTVTKRKRRVATPSFETLRMAALQNDATESVVTFIEYLGWENRLAKSFAELNDRAYRYINLVEETTGVPVIGISTGPMHDQMIWR